MNGKEIYKSIASFKKCDLSFLLLLFLISLFFLILQRGSPGRVSSFCSDNTESNNDFVKIIDINMDNTTQTNNKHNLSPDSEELETSPLFMNSDNPSLQISSLDIYSSNDSLFQVKSLFPSQLCSDSYSGIFQSNNNNILVRNNNNNCNNSNNNNNTNYILSSPIFSSSVESSNIYLSPPILVHSESTENNLPVPHQVVSYSLFKNQKPPSREFNFPLNNNNNNYSSLSQSPDDIPSPKLVCGKLNETNKLFKAESFGSTNSSEMFHLALAPIIDKTVQNESTPVK
jgi:hypothetical protein